jgi:hypothetical protein
MNMKKIVIHGLLAFELSDLAMKKLAKRKGVKLYPERTSTDYILWTVPKAERTKYPEDEPSTKEMEAYYEYLFAHSWAHLVYSIERDDPDLVAIVEELGKKASGEKSYLHIVEIPDDVKWEINEDDESGGEWVEEKHRTWR